MKESLSVRFLYQTIIGRMILKVLVRPSVSRFAGYFLDSSVSRIFISTFRKNNHISMENVIVPEGGFPSFNAFFSRNRVQEKNINEENVLYSPCDSFLSFIPISSENTIFNVKHTVFSVKDLVQDEELAKEYVEGVALIFRLTPAHFHRYSYAVNGIVNCEKKIPGILHCVRPIVTRNIPVYAQNAREYQVIDTEVFGKVVQMEVGALMVGRITNKKEALPKEAIALQEKGYFEFGGSTIILLFKKDSVEFVDSIKDLCGDAQEEELSVKQGQVLGKGKMN